MLRSSLFRKILLAFILLALFGTGLDLIFSRELAELSQEQELLTRESYKILRQTERLRVARLSMEAAVDDFFYTGETRFRDRYSEAHDAFTQALAATRHVVANKPDELKLLVEVDRTLQAWEKETVEPAFALRAKLPAGQAPPASALAQFPHAVSSEQLEQIRRQIVAFEDREMGRADTRRLSLEERARVMKQVFWFFDVLAALFAIGVGLIVGANVSRTVSALVRGVEKISAGEYHEVPVTSEDEIGALARAFNRMVEALRSHDAQLHSYVEQQRTEVETLSKTLDQQKSRFETVLNTIVDGVIMVDAEGKILMCNPKACEIFGVSDTEMTQLHLADLMERFRRLVINPEELETKINALRANPGSTEEVTFEFKDPAYGAIRLYSVPLYGSDGRLMGRVATSLDISKEKEIDRLKREFISTVSHELRTPLTSIKGSLGLIAGGAVGEITPDMRELLQIAQNNTERLIRLINDILDVFRIESGRIRLRPTPICVGDSIQRAMAAAEAYAGKTQVRLEADVPDDLPQVLADPQRVDQVIINLISNAVKFSPTGEAVTVAARLTAAAHGETSLQEGRAWVEVSVRDRGKGIPEPFLQRIFNKFEQADSSSTREHGGTGLGLTISRAIVEQHGGRIWVESQLGVGSTFFFTLPVLDDGSVRPAPVAAVSERSAGRS